MWIFLIIIFALYLLYPVISRWLGPIIQRWLMRKAVEKFARNAGFDMPGMGGKSAKKENKKSGRKSQSYQTPPRQRPQSHGEHIIPPEYAEDVEFVEIKSYSEEVTIGEDRRQVKVEQQVTDAEILEITRYK